jgi:hypothetical protein
MILAIKTSVAFGLDGERTPERDDWEIENVEVPDREKMPEVFNSFIKSRYNGAFAIIECEISPEQRLIARGDLEAALQEWRNKNKS